jgi:hypothetical protein
MALVMLEKLSYRTIDNCLHLGFSNQFKIQSHNDFIHPIFGNYNKKQTHLKHFYLQYAKLIVAYTCKTHVLRANTHASCRAGLLGCFEDLLLEKS